MQMQDVRLAGFDQRPELPHKGGADRRKQEPCPHAGSDDQELISIGVEAFRAGVETEPMIVYQCCRVYTPATQCKHCIAHIVFQSTVKRREILSDMQDFQAVGLC